MSLKKLAGEITERHGVHERDVAHALERAAARIDELETALFRYGQHEPDCRYAELRPDAECTCGLEAVING